MESYHVHFNARQDVPKDVLLAQVHEFMANQIESNRVRSYRLLELTDKASFQELRDFHLIVDYENAEDLQDAFNLMKQHYKDAPHAPLMKMVAEFRVAFSRDVHAVTEPVRSGDFPPLEAEASAHRISFTSDHLIDQIIEGRKTASTEWVHKQGEENEWDSALEVGAVYTVFDSHRIPRCTIRLTSIRLCQWNSIPEWLWKGETNNTPDEFRADHVLYFDNPKQDFEFLGYEFEFLNAICVDD
ncbi:MAG: DUF6614 family protein [Verrucomicrobiales bacterium]